MVQQLLLIFAKRLVFVSLLTFDNNFGVCMCVMHISILNVFMLPGNIESDQGISDSNLIKIRSPHLLFYCWAQNSDCAKKKERKEMSKCGDIILIRLQ